MSLIKEDNKICYLCKSGKKNTIKYGEFFLKKGIGVHYYCLLLTSKLVQNGSEDDEGFQRFLENDIKAEARRIRRQVCCYCNQQSANIGCCRKKCRRTFHFICGIENGAQNQFVNTYKSFCDRHVYKNFRSYVPNDENCIICMENLDAEKNTMNLQLPCCKNGWFHKWCMQEYANNAGYFIKCPLCNNSDSFNSKLQYTGIFIPEQDATWELEPNAFAELIERPKKCSAIICLSRKGRLEHDSDNYDFVYCSTCGSVAQHIKCTVDKKSFTCIDCNAILLNHQHKSINDNSDSGLSIDDGEVSVADGNTSEPITFDILRRRESILQAPIIDVEAYNGISFELTDIITRFLN